MTGPELLAGFLVAKGVTRGDCAKALKVSRTALYYWLTEKTSPGDAAREDIAIWTRGKVPAKSWGPHADHRKESSGAVKPFRGAGHGLET